MKSQEKGTPPKAQIVVVGSINVDHVTSVDRLPGPGETVSGQGTRLLAGGKGANQAVAAARLGASTALIASVGRDSNAAVASAGLTAAGVDISGIMTVEADTGAAIVTVDAKGENTIVVIAGANACTDGEAARRHSAAIAAAGILVVQGEIPDSGTETAVSLATGRVVLNLAPAVNLAPAIIRSADPLVVNEHEAALVLRQLNPAMPTPSDHLKLTAALLDAGPRSVVLTRGAQGALFTDSGTVRAVPAPRVDAIDTTGAGDAFVGALSASLATGAALGEAVQFASRVGAYSVQRTGTQMSYPTSADVLPEVAR